MGYIHVEINSCQLNKNNGIVCGDIISSERDKISTIVILCDGIGSGIKANIAAQLCISRMLELIKAGFSIRQAFSAVVKTMEEAKVKELPYAVFTLIRILNDGIATVLSYEMPEPIFVAQKYSSVLKQRITTINRSVVGESSCILNPGEGIIVVSDGITQSGLRGLKTEWTPKGIVRFINDFLSNGGSHKILSQEILMEAKLNWRNELKDDCSVVYASTRKGRVVNILTGPPANKKDDREMVDKFMSLDGIKIICGASTAKIVAREINKTLHVDDKYVSAVTPPSYEIEGINLVTEGAITLNQLYNIWDEDENKLDKDSPITELKCLLNVADRINIFLGGSENPADDDIDFKLTGILHRKIIVNLLSDKFKRDGKLVVLENI